MPLPLMDSIVVAALLCVNTRQHIVPFLYCQDGKQLYVYLMTSKWYNVSGDCKIVNDSE